jgi:predicted ester cyclase
MVDNAEWDDITMPEVAKGKQGVLKYFQIFTKAFPDAKLASQNVWGIGDYVIEEGTYAGTHTGPLMGTPPTKKQFSIHELNIVQLDKDDKIVKGWTFGSDVELLTQLGLMKPPAAK